jgi:methylglutaconyl-CoA hydratase
MSLVLAEQKQPGVLWLTLNRPDVHNAFNDVVIQELMSHLDRVESDPEIRVVVLASSGPSFSAGADLNWMKSMRDLSYEENIFDALQLASLLYRLNHCSKPTICRIQGAAFGGGVGLVSCCDMAVALESATFALSEVKIGLIPATISPYVVRAMGERNARRFFQTAESFTAERANAMRLLHEVVADEAEMDVQIERWVNALLENGPHAMSESKRLIGDVVARPLSEDILRCTSEWIAKVRISPEGQEGLRAFLDKRKPDWKSNPDKDEL